MVPKWRTLRVWMTHLLRRYDSLSRCCLQCVCRFVLAVSPAPDPNSVPTPRELFRRWEAGLMTREAFQAAMAVHARELIDEMVEAKLNPVQACIEEVSNRAAAFKLTVRHGEKLIRELLVALSLEHDFLPARFLWNANHHHIPLHCFFRSRREPVFRIIRMSSTPLWLTAEVEYGRAEKPLATREEFLYRRNRRGELQLERRRPIQLQ